MESTGIPHGVHETLFEESPWSPCVLLEMLNVVLLKSMESPQSPHGVCGNVWGSVKYSDSPNRDTFCPNNSKD